MTPLRCRLMPAPPRQHAGTASQLIPGVRRKGRLGPEEGTEGGVMFLRELPKAELHVHIEGTLEPDLMFELSRRNRVPIRFKSVDEVAQAYQFTNLQSFLDICYEGARLLIEEQDFHDLTWA